MTFIKNYWFGTLIGALLLGFLLLFVLIMISPKQDAKGRGFVLCTQEMVDDLLICDKKISCSIGAIFRNTICDIKVIGKGVSYWIKGKQPYPWSNYIFEPEIPKNTYVDEAAREEYLSEFPETAKEMQMLKKLNKELENEQNMQINFKEIMPEE